MPFNEITPSVIRSLHYLHQIAQHYPNSALYAGGHSKGGTLAVYASMMQSAEEAYDAERYHSICSRILQYRPQFSAVGFLYDRKDPYQLVHSDGTRFLQTDPITWTIENCQIKRASHLDPEAVSTAFSAAGSTAPRGFSEWPLYRNSFLHWLPAVLQPSQISAQISSITLPVFYLPLQNPADAPNRPLGSLRRLSSLHCRITI